MLFAVYTRKVIGRQLTRDCCLKIEKVRLNLKRHVKYAICTIYEKGNWTAITDYTKAPMLSKFDGSTCTVAVRSVDVKGVKRKVDGALIGPR